MLEKILKYKNSRFVRNVVVIASGTAAAQVITVAFSPLLTRLYGPAAFGLLGTFTAITHTLSPLAGLCYPTAIVLPKEEAEAAGLVRLSTYAGLAVAVILFSVLLFAKDTVAEALNLQAIGAFIFLVPFTLVFATFYQTSQQQMLRKKLFKLNAKISVAQSVILNIAKSGMGFFYPSGSILIGLASIENALHAGMQTWGLKRTEKNGTKSGTEPRVSLRRIAKKYYDFPLYRAPQMFINTASQSLPVLLLASFFGPSAAGFYSLGRKVLSMPTTLIGRSVGNVFYPRIAEAANKGENLYRLIVKATGALILVGAFPFGIVVLLGPWLFGLVFGADWIKAGEYARWISLWTFFSFINRPSLLAMPVLALQRFFLLYEIVSSIFLAGGILLGFHIFSNDIYAVAIFSSVGVFMNIVLMLIVLKYAAAWRSSEGNR